MSMLPADAHRVLFKPSGRDFSHLLKGPIGGGRDYDRDEADFLRKHGFQFWRSTFGGRERFICWRYEASLDCRNKV